MAKITKKKTLTTYEENLIWMSYRYCIGRHTIAACGHAGDILSNSYHKLSRERALFMAYDIRREINNILRCSRLNFYFYEQDSQDNENYLPLEAYFDCINKNNLVEFNDLDKIKKITCKRFGEYEIEYEENPTKSTYRTMDLDDLLPWANLANAFDYRQHRLITCTDPQDGKVKQFECVPVYICTDRHKYQYEKFWTTIERMIVNPSIQTYISPEYITKVEPIKK